MTSHVYEREWRGDPAGALVEPVQLLVVGASRALYDALRLRLLREPDVVDVCVVVSVEDAVSLLLASGSNFDVVIAERAAAEGMLRALGPPGSDSPPPVIVLGDSSEVRQAMEVFRLGAVGWVDATSSVAALMATARAARLHTAAVPLPLFQQLLTDSGTTSPPSRRDEALAKLSERERQILELLELGFGRREIASALQLSPNTVRTHVQSILRRLNVHSALAAIALVRSTTRDQY